MNINCVILVRPGPVDIEVLVPSDHVVDGAIHRSQIALHGQVGPNQEAVVAGLVGLQLGSASNNPLDHDLVPDDPNLLEMRYL